MKLQILLAAFILLLNAGYAQEKSPADLVSRFDSILSAQFRPGETGATVLVARKGEIIYKKAFGMANLELDVPMQPDKVFRIASITKQFTAIAILQLEEQGKLKTSDDITKYLPGYPTHGEKITIENLLTHTSGIPDFAYIRDSVDMGRSDLTPQQMTDRFKNLPLRFKPGTKWEYSNSGYFLLGYLVEKISGKSYASYLDENIFKPLGMTGSTYSSDSKIIKNRAPGYTAGERGYENAPYMSMTHPYAAGAILSTVNDLFIWQQAVNANKLVKKETQEKAFKKYVLANGNETGYGYGWRIGNVYKSPSLWHGGLINGFRSMALYLPEEDVFVTILANCDCNAPEEAAYIIASLAAGRAARDKEIVVPAKVLAGYVGVYENQKGQQRIITLSGNKLFTQLGRGPKSLIRSFEKGNFFYDAEPMSSVEFTRDNKGNIQSLTTVSLRGMEVWNKTENPLPSENGIQLPENILKLYAGEYAINPDFTFSITTQQDKIYLQATGQEKLEMFADSETEFFLKVNDAQIEFVKDEKGRVIKAVLKQGGRVADAAKVE